MYVKCSLIQKRKKGMLCNLLVANSRENEDHSENKPQVEESDPVTSCDVV